MKLHRKLPERVLVYIKYLLSSKKNPKYMTLNKDEKKVFVFLAGFYQNLGDMAITYSQKKFLQDLYPDAKIVLVPSTETYTSIKTIKRFVNEDDIITTIDGGNMDDLYPSLEEARTFVVRSFPHNKVVSFPQTISFRDTANGRKLLKHSRKIYSKHKDFTICVREEYSRERVKQYFPNVKTIYCPDIVLYLNETQPKIERTNILCCLRQDKEQNISKQAREELIDNISERYQNVLCKDTVDVDLENGQIDTYEKTLKDFWAMLRSCKLVVTDRLHCMVFCAITETPCIVMDNTNKKISGVYNQWLSSAKWIKMLENYDKQKILTMVDEFLKNEPNCKIVNMEEYFNCLKQACVVKKENKKFFDKSNF